MQNPLFSVALPTCAAVQELCVGVEAATRFGWDKYIGKNGIFIGMNNFGASAPGHQLFEYFGINSTEIVKAVRARL